MFLVKAAWTRRPSSPPPGVVLAVVVDMARLVVYGFDLAGQAHRIDWLLVAPQAALLFAAPTAASGCSRR